MSGNPFRRSRLPDEHETIPTAALGLATGSSEAAPPIPPARTKKKRVKIQTPPPQSPDDSFSRDINGARRISASDATAHANSPPPPASMSQEHERESDSFATADIGLEEALGNRTQNSGVLPPSPITPPTAAAVKAPYNPFARTSATNDAAFGLQRDNNEEDDLGRRHDNGRPTMDMESFKNILLTGSATPADRPAGGATATAPSMTLSRPHHRSSSIGNSSAFDPAYGMHPASPRMSFDGYDDPSTSEDENSDERSTLMGQGRSDDLAPPAPPKQKIRGPQTVSFADFDQAIPPNFQAPVRGTSPNNTHLLSILRPSLSRSSSDLNKPLPPPPDRVPEPTSPPVPEKDFSLSPQITPSAPTINEQVTPKKAPPPPPTRRKAGDNDRPRSVSISSDATQDSIGSAAMSQPETSRSSDFSGKLAPPPPPSRRLLPVSSPLSEDSSKSLVPNASADEVPKSAPVPPPRRQSSKSRSGDNTARSSLDVPPAQKPGDAFLATVAPYNAPPAPPPRRGGLKGSSADGVADTVTRGYGSDNSRRRSSGNSFDSQNSALTSSLQRISKQGEQENIASISRPAQNQSDILADMTAFQAEIDALRAQNQAPG